MYSLSSVSPAPDQVQIPVQYPVPTRLLSPEELRTSFWQIVQNRLLHHANFHSANCFTRAASKLPLDRLVEFIYSMQASNLPVQLAFLKEVSSLIQRSVKQEAGSARSSLNLFSTRLTISLKELGFEVPSDIHILV